MFSGELKIMPISVVRFPKIPEFSGFDSSIISILRGGILISIGNFPETSSQRILVGIILVGRLGMPKAAAWMRPGRGAREGKRLFRKRRNGYLA